MLVNSWNPNRTDPTRTTMLRRRFLADIRRRFKRLKADVRKLVADDDAFGMAQNLASTQIDLPQLKPLVAQIQRGINLTDVVKFDRNPHVTVRYGFTDETPEQVQQLLAGAGVIRAKLGKLSAFENSDEDVLKVEVDSKQLHDLNKLLESLPNESRFKDYEPHLTIAYLKPGTARKYLDLINPFEGRTVAVDRITFSDSLRRGTEIVVNTRFAFMSSPDKLKAFTAWLKKLLVKELAGRDEAELWKRFVEEGFKRGAGRSFDDVRKSELRKEHPELFSPGEEGRLKDFYDGSKSEFLNSAFNRPVGIEKVKVLASRTFTDIEGVTDAVARKMRRTLTEGLIQGQHSRDIAKDLAEDLDWALPRAERVARTEVSRAYVEGQLDALELMGVEELGVMVEWTTAGDSHVCPLCVELEDKVFSIEDARGVFPAHPECRCALIPSLKQNRRADGTSDRVRLHPLTNAAVRISREQLLKIVANIRREAKHAH